MVQDLAQTVLFLGTGRTHARLLAHMPSEPCEHSNFPFPGPPHRAPGWATGTTKSRHSENSAINRETLCRIVPTTWTA